MLRGVGVVLSTRRRCWPAAAADRRFLDLQDIQAPIIHEVCGRYRGAVAPVEPAILKQACNK